MGSKGHLKGAIQIRLASKVKLGRYWCSIDKSQIRKAPPPEKRIGGREY